MVVNNTAFDQDELIFHAFEKVHGFLSGKVDFYTYVEKIGISSNYSLVEVNQVHGSNIVRISDDKELEKFLKIPIQNRKYDGIISTHKPLIATIKTADCVPVIFNHSHENVVGILHCGWRSIAGGIVQNALSLLQKELQIDSDGLFFWIGPAICQNCYEVGDEVIEEFSHHISISELMHDSIVMEKYDGSKKKNNIDLKKIVKTILNNNTIDSTRIWTSEICTRCHLEFFSYRENQTSNRNISFVALY